ncbi:MAG: helix-hairpin-helix domain-containing protein [Pseudomonadota bacterium]
MSAISIVLLILGILLLFIAAGILLGLGKSTTVMRDGTAPRGDVLDKGAAPASRNQALIDSAPAAAPQPAPAPAPTPAPTPAPAPAPKAAPTPAPAPKPAPAPSTPDDLTTIKGVGPKLAGMLKDQGITTFAQIAAWSESDIERVDSMLGKFQGRITRDHWVEQAKLLASGDKSAFAAKFGQNT